MGANQRLQKEAANLRKDPPPLCTVEPVGESLYIWKATIKGPPDSPYNGGTFKLDIQIPSEYPFKPPQVKFATKIYHPNVGTNGEICLDVIKGKWTPGMTISSVMISIGALMCDPNPDSPMVPYIGEQFKNDPAGYKRSAAEYTKRFATPPS